MKYKKGFPNKFLLKIEAGFQTKYVKFICCSKLSYLAACYDNISTIYGMNPLKRSTFSKVIYKFNDHKENINSLSFSPCENYFATASNDTYVIIYELKDNKANIKIKLKHLFAIFSVTFGECGQYLACCGVDYLVSLYSLQYYNKSNGRKSNDNGNDNSTISNGKSNVKSNYNDNNTSSTTDDSNNKQFAVLLHIFTYHTLMVTIVCFSQCGLYLASGSNDCTVKLYNLKQIVPIKQLKQLDNNFTNNNNINSNNKDNLEVNKSSYDFTLSNNACSIDFGNFDEYMVVGSVDNSLYLFYKENIRSNCNSYSNSNSIYVNEGNNDKIKWKNICKIDKDTFILSPFPALFNFNGRNIVTGDFEGFIHVYNIEKTLNSKYFKEESTIKSMFDRGICNLCLFKNDIFLVSSGSRSRDISICV